MLFKNKFSAVFNEKTQIFRHNFIFALSMLLMVSGFIYLLVNTGFVYNNLFVAIILLILIYPFRDNSKLLIPYLLCISCIFLGWLIIGLGSTLFPFIFAIVIAYLLNPLVVKLEKRGIPRWLSSLALILFSLGLLILVAVFFFPILFEQADTISKQISQYVSNIKELGTSKTTYSFFKQFGIDRATIQEAFNTELLPRIEAIATKLFNVIVNILINLSSASTQVINIIIFPFLTFYFLKDFHIFVDNSKKSIIRINPNIHKYISKFNALLRIYIRWQLTAATIVATVGSIVWTVFGVPYGILIACIAGLLNPIPYFGSIFSIVIGTIVALLVNDGNFTYHFIVITSTIIGIHFINAYLLEPAIAGNKVGLHPVIMILSVFIFNSLFGIIGMLIAVPATAVVLMLVKDLYSELKINEQASDK